MARPRKGDRTPTTVRFPDEHYAIYKREAQRHGLELSDYLAMVAAQAHSLELPAYIHPAKEAERMSA